MANADTKSQLLSRDQAHLIHSLHDRQAHQAGHVWIKGEGAILTDADGKQYIDALAGLWNVIAGHGRRELADAAAAQMRALPYCSGYAGSSNPRAIELAERLARLTYPSINRFFFASGGGEASDTSFKMARYYWKLKGKPEKTKVISRQWAYHGVTLAAMSATGISSYWPLFEPRVPGFIHIPSPYPYRYEAPPGVSQGVAAANELEQAILREGPDTVAMFIAEPVQGAGGVIVPQDDYFPRIREICDQYDVLLVADEVITGFGRTGRMFALDHWGVEPDMIQFAKGITSGYFPLGGIGVSDAIAAVLDSGQAVWMHAYTYSAHPVGCAVALRNLDIMEEEDFPSQAAEKGAYLLEHLQAALSDHAHVGQVRGKGLMCAIELVRDKATKAEFPPEEQIGAKVHQAAQERGLFSRLRGDVFCLAPPIVVGRDQLDRIVRIMTESVEEVLGRRGPMTTSDQGKPPRAGCRSYVVIPARLASTRLPRKLLLRETGKSLIQHTYEAACRATRPLGVCVATDHEEIAEEVRRFGGRVELTDPHAASGTDRVAELAAEMPDVDVLVNVQGDEPEIAGAVIDLAIELLEDNPDAVMSTLAAPIRSREKLEDPACVKVVFDVSGQALYFSRSPIPHARDFHDGLLSDCQPHFYQHIGLYAYRREFLLKLARMPRSDLEKLENLEQLRVLTAGYPLLVAVIDEPTTGIDTPEDYRAFVRRMTSC